MGFGVSKSSEYLVLVFTLVGGFHFSSRMPGLGTRVCFIGYVFKVLNQGLSTNLRDFFFLGIFYFHALILFYSSCIERLIDLFYNDLTCAGKEDRYKEYMSER